MNTHRSDSLSFVTVLSSGEQATQAAEDVLAARASAHAHELNEVRRELSSAREDTKRFVSVTPCDTAPVMHACTFVDVCGILHFTSLGVDVLLCAL